ncbi:MAG TPA: heparinase II/III-family protein [Candidatus Paenibacillus intestinavium]|nr:heparinase II/III-family protein [Candidatus Paenibacillus intestinavium]
MSNGMGNRFEALHKGGKSGSASELLCEMLKPRQRGLQLLAAVDTPLQLGKRLREDASLVSIIGEVEAEANRMLKETEPKLTNALFRMYEETGERIPYERAYFEKRKRLNTFAIMSLLRSEQKDYREALLHTAWSICDEETWCLPAHYEEEQGLLCSIDLFAAETGFALAELDTLLEDNLPSALRERIAMEIEHRLLRPFMEEGPYRWEQLENNWSAVCAGSIGAAALYLIKDTNRLSLLLVRVLDAMDYFLAGYGADGACVEGYSYWQYGFGYYVYFFSLLKEATSGGIDGFASNKVKEIALFQQRCFSGGDTIINFSDALPRSGIFMGLTWRLYDEYADIVLPNPSLRASYAADHCGRWAPAIRNLLWVARQSKSKNSTIDCDDKLEAESWPSISHYMPNAGWFISRIVKENGSTYCFAAKGGHNAEPHNHNDCGHFILHADGEAYLADLGSGMYTKSYFGPERYSFWCNGSQGHSVPIVEGKGQLEGSESHAKVTNMSISPEEDSVEMEFSAAYPEVQELLSLERSFRWNKEGLPTLTLYDRAVFEDNLSKKLTERFITMIEPKLEGEGRVTLTGKHRMTIEYDDARWTPVITVRSDMDHFGKERQWYTLDFVRLQQSTHAETGEVTFYFQFQ